MSVGLAVLLIGIVLLFTVMPTLGLVLTLFGVVLVASGR